MLNHTFKEGFLNYCQICNTKKIFPVIDLGYQPLADDLRKETEKNAPTINYPIKIYLCRSCRLLQNNYIVGDKNCKVLIVKENMKTEWNGEQLVVAEPNAEIIFKGTKMKAGQDPLGNIDNIEDARYWIINNKKFKPLLKEKNVVFIATGSPAKILWKKFLKHH